LLDPQKIINSIKTGSKKPILKYVFKPVLWILKFVYRVLTIFSVFKAMDLLMAIGKLERDNKYDEARRLREKWLKDAKIAKYPELWFSQGNDLLFKQNEPGRALYAFERAINANKDFNPIELYYGAACSALMENKIDKARVYYFTFNRWWDEFMENPKLKGYYFTKFLGCKNWLDGRMKNI
jgi:tetratricopeptide (TPR) repeat protein